MVADGCQVGGDEPRELPCLRLGVQQNKFICKNIVVRGLGDHAEDKSWRDEAIYITK